MGYAKNILMQRDARTMTVNQYHGIDMGYFVLVVMITDVIIQDHHSIHVVSRGSSSYMGNV
jgi:hypothetical protein